MVEFVGIIDDAVATIRDEERTVDELYYELEGQEGELVQDKLDELERAGDRIKRLANLALKGVRKAKRIKNWLAENIPRGPKLVEYMAESTMSDVEYVSLQLRREDIGVLVFVEDWGVEELSMIDELGGSLNVHVVRRSSTEHPPTEFCMFQNPIFNFFSSQMLVRFARKIQVFFVPNFSSQSLLFRPNL